MKDAEDNGAVWVCFFLFLPLRSFYLFRFYFYTFLYVKMIDWIDQTNALVLLVVGVAAVVNVRCDGMRAFNLFLCQKDANFSWQSNKSSTKSSLILCINEKTAAVAVSMNG